MFEELWVLPRVKLLVCRASRMERSELRCSCSVDLSMDKRRSSISSREFSWSDASLMLVSNDEWLSVSPNLVLLDSQFKRAKKLSQT